MLSLSESLDLQFVNAINQIEEKHKMTYTTSVERKFGHVPDWAKARMAQADETALTGGAVRVLDAPGYRSSS